MRETSNFSVLMREDICRILCGDKRLGFLSVFDDFGERRPIEICLPHISLTQFCKFSNEYGLEKDESSYDHRWKYVEALIGHCIEQETCSNMLNRLFNPEILYMGFSRRLDFSVVTLKNLSHSIYEKILDGINKILNQDGYRLTYKNGIYDVEEIGEHLKIQSQSIVSVRNVSEMADRVKDDIVRGAYDSAMTKTRSMLESVFIHMIEKKGETPPRNGDMGKLYRRVTVLYGLNGEKGFGEIFGGLNSIVGGIANVRNEFSDAHGGDENRVMPDKQQARLALNAAMTMVEYLLSV